MTVETLTLTLYHTDITALCIFEVPAADQVCWYDPSASDGATLNGEHPRETLAFLMIFFMDEINTLQNLQDAADNLSFGLLLF